MRLRRVLLAVMLAGLLAGVLAAPAAAATGHLAVVQAPFALLGIDFPSVKSIVEDVIQFFFATLLDALVPDWLKHAGVGVIKRLVTIPNPTDERVWPTLAQLSEGMKWIAIPLLSLAAVAGWTQQWIREMTGRPSSLSSVLSRTVLAALLLVAYPVFFGQAVALVNSVTNAMLSLPAVGDGLERTVGLVFAGTILSGSGVLLALLGIAAVVLGVGLFMLSVGLLVLFGILYVSAPLAIVSAVVDETRGIWTAWRYALLSAALVPIGWCILFATAGAFMLDMTRWSGGIAGTLGARFVGVFAAIIIFWLAVRWPLMLWSKIKLHIGGALASVGSTAPGGSGGGSQAGGRAARAALARSSMRAAEGVTSGLRTTGRYAATSARVMLGSGAQAAGRVPGAGAATGAVARAVAPALAAAAPAVAAAAPLALRTTQAAGAVRQRAQAATTAGKSALGKGATTREAAGAAFGTATRSHRTPPADSPRDPVPSPAGRGQPPVSRRERPDGQQSSAARRRVVRPESPSPSSAQPAPSAAKRTSIAQPQPAGRVGVSTAQTGSPRPVTSPTPAASPPKPRNPVTDRPSRPERSAPPSRPTPRPSSSAAPPSDRAQPRPGRRSRKGR